MLLNKWENVPYFEKKSSIIVKEPSHPNPMLQTFLTTNIALTPFA